MAVLLDLVVSGEPRGKARHRSRIIAPAGKKPFVATYHAERDPCVTWERFVQGEAARAWAGKPALDEPVRLIVEAVGVRPGVLKRLGRGRLWKTSAPDVDNVVKAVADALQEAGVVVNDTRCSEVIGRSYVAAEGEAPHTRIIVEELAPLPLDPWPEKARAKSAPKPSLDLF